MVDYTDAHMEVNQGAGTDASPVWTGTTIQFSGSGGANEFRFQRTGGGSTGATGSAAWANIIKPGSVAAVEEFWAFSGDTAGAKCTTYDGGRTYGRVFRFSFDALGSPASPMQVSAFQDSADTTPTPGTQTGNATDGRNIINGHVTDTGSTSYFKMNAFGSGFPAAGAQETPSAGNVGTTLAATSGTGGSVSPGAGAWLATWQSAQGWTQYITAPATAKALQAFYWYLSLALYVGPNMQTGNMVWVPFTLQYTWT